MRLIKIDEKKNKVYVYNVKADVEKLDELRDEIAINCGMITSFFKLKKNNPEKPIDKRVIIDTYEYEDEFKNDFDSGVQYIWQGFRFASTDLTKDIAVFTDMYKNKPVHFYEDDIELLLALSGNKEYPTKEEIEKKNNDKLKNRYKKIHDTIDFYNFEEKEVTKEELIDSMLSIDIDNMHELIKANKKADELRVLKDQNDYIKEVAKLISFKCINSMDLDTYKAAMNLSEGGYRLKPKNNKNKTN